MDIIFILLVTAIVVAVSSLISFIAILLTNEGSLPKLTLNTFRGPIIFIIICFFISLTWTALNEYTKWTKQPHTTESRR